MVNKKKLMHCESMYYFMNSTIKLNDVLDLHSAISSTSFINFVPKCLQYLNDIMRFENSDIADGR
jgi:hypothetical protein